MFFCACKTQKEPTVAGIKITPEEKAIRDSMIRISASTYIVEGTTYKLNGNFEQAAISFTKCLSLEPSNDAAHFNLSAVYAGLGDANKAIFHGEKAAELDPKNEWYLLQLARIYQYVNQKPKACLAFNRLVKLKPDKRDYAFYYADALVQNGEESKALEVLNSIEKSKGFDEDVVYQKYRIFAFLKKYKEAITELEKLASHHSDDVTYYGMIAELYEEQNDKENALKYYHKILSIDPTNGFAHLALAQFYYAQDDNINGFKELKSAFQSEALEIDIKLKVLFEYYDRPNDSNQTEAYELLDITSQSHSANAKIWGLYGEFLRRDHRYEESRDKFRKALSLDENVFAFWSQLIALDIELNDKTSIYRDAKKAADLFPTQPNLFYYYGLGAYQNGKFDEAIEALTVAKDMIVENVALQIQCFQLLGECYHKTKQYSESDKAFENGLKISPNDVYILNNYAYYLAVRKTNLNKAEEMSKLVNDLQPNQSNFEDTYAFIFLRKNNLEAAMIWIKKALSHGGDGVGIIVEHYGDILYHAGKITEALEQWKKAKSIGDCSEWIDQKIKEKKYFEN